MPASRPKRKKLIVILLLIGGRASDQLDLNNDGTVYEVLLNQLAALKPQMAIDEVGWSQEQMDVWTKVEEINEDASPSDFERISEELEELIAEL